jgi:hypothetical protein
MENNNRNPYSKRNKQRRQHQQHGHAIGNNRSEANSRSEANGREHGMTSPVSTANHSMNDNMNVSMDNGPTIDLSVNESMISTASSGLFGDDAGMEDEIINNMVLPPTPQVVHQQSVSNVRINQSTIVDRNYNPNEDESYSIALRQQMMEVRVRYHSDIPRVRDANQNLGYYDIKVHLNKSTNPWEEVIEAYREAMIILWSSDPTIKIHVFNDIDRRSDHSFIGKEDDFVDIRKFDFLKFFSRGIPLSKSGPRTAKVLMSHTKDFNSIMEACGQLLKLEDKGVFKCNVQAEKTTVIGWGYMTTRQTNKEELSAAITQTIGIPVGLQWRMITTGQAMDKIPEEQKVRALHFEVEDEDVDYAKRVLGDLYHHSRCVGFPLGIRLRFMPIFSRVPNSTGRTELLKVIGYQQRFCDKIGEYISADIRDIAGLLPNGQSIRDYIMDIFVDNDQRKPLLTAVNKTWNNSGYVFNFLPQFREEATLTVQNILTKLRFEFPGAREESGRYPTIDNHFDLAAIGRADDTIWDPIENCAKAKLDDAMKGVLAAMKGNDEFFAFHEEIQVANPVAVSPVTKSKPGDKDEISIARGGISINSRASRSQPNRSSVSFAGSVMSPISLSGETNTIASGMSRAEVKQLVVQTMEENIARPLQQMQQQMNALVTRMDQNFHPFPPNQPNYAAAQQDDGEQHSL